ncbi:MAG: hypothetical protein ACLQBK_14750 [Candidatus Sulfotelmatobacter sp.]
MKIVYRVTPVKLAITCTFMLAACLLGQDRGGTSLGEARMRIGDVFSKADASGSLEYWGVCNFKELYPDFPKLRVVPVHEGSPVELLREMFSVDHQMRVSQDSDGKIRMVETDVPSDLLDVKIHELRWLTGYHGPNIAITAILKTPEVITFRREHNIGPEAEWGPLFGLPSEAVDLKRPSLIGGLHDVTVRQALDHVLLAFHGFWWYENCKNPGGGRIVNFGFLENEPSAVPVETQKLPTRTK